MNKERQTELFNAAVEKLRFIIFSKGDDYNANTEDRLSNFKLAGLIARSSAQQNCLEHIATKAVRLGALVNSTEAENHESIEDTLIDLANYSILMAMIREENGRYPTKGSDGTAAEV